MKKRKEHCTTELYEPWSIPEDSVFQKSPTAKRGPTTVDCVVGRRCSSREATLCESPGMVMPGKRVGGTESRLGRHQTTTTEETLSRSEPLLRAPGPCRPQS